MILLISLYRVITEISHSDKQAAYTLHLLARIQQIGVVHVRDHTSVVRKSILVSRESSLGTMGKY
jgi:hypothetical protein